MTPAASSQELHLQRALHLGAHVAPRFCEEVAAFMTQGLQAVHAVQQQAFAVIRTMSGRRPIGVLSVAIGIRQGCLRTGLYS